MADRQDFGIKVSQSGYNAINAPDYNLAFSSSWPQLPIMAEYVTTVSPFNGGSPPYTYNPVVFTHNLGYPALAMAWTQSTGSAPTRVRRDPYNTSIGKNATTYNSPITTSNLSDTLTVFIRVYGLDISSPVSYIYKQPPIISSPYDPDYGIKIVKDGKQITSKDMRDFIIHSRCQSPQVDSVNVAPKGSGVAYTNSTGYTNWVFGFGSFNNGVTWNGARTDFHQSAPSMFIANNVYTINATTNMVPSIVVLRDPLFVASQVEVIY